MWANSVWGFFGLCVSFLGLRVGMIWTTGHEWLGPVFLWGAGVSLSISLVLLIWPAWRRTHPIPSLFVFFDKDNPNRKFWSHESPRDERGAKLPGVFWEYRVEVCNVGSETLTNIKATIEGQGALPMRQQAAIFDISRSDSLERLHPGERRLLIVLQWPIPPIQAGMMVGEDAYGPLLVSVGADNSPSVSRTFRLDYQRTPMLAEMPARP